MTMRVDISTGIDIKGTIEKEVKVEVKEEEIKEVKV